jgi:hypothetical protein
MATQQPGSLEAHERLEVGDNGGWHRPAPSGAEQATSRGNVSTRRVGVVRWCRVSNRRRHAVASFV